MMYKKGVIPWRYYAAEVIPLTLPIGVILLSSSALRKVKILSSAQRT